MLEKLVYDTLRKQVEIICTKYQKPLLFLKGFQEEKEVKFQEYLSKYNWSICDETIYYFSRRGRRNKTHLMCYFFFKKNSEKLLEIFVDKTYKDLEAAMENTKNFDELFQEFIDWFQKEREKFRFRMNVDIKKINENAVKIKKSPQSHGGVANLLKVLTKTMEKQGSDISTVAKVQYAICIQAGIYIPAEFIEDVAVALDIEENH